MKRVMNCIVYVGGTLIVAYLLATLDDPEYRRRQAEHIARLRLEEKYMPIIGPQQAGATGTIFVKGDGAKCDAVQFMCFRDNQCAIAVVKDVC